VCPFACREIKIVEVCLDVIITYINNITGGRALLFLVMCATVLTGDYGVVMRGAWCLSHTACLQRLITAALPPQQCTNAGVPRAVAGCCGCWGPT